MIKLKPHQEEAVAKLHNGCVLYGDVGGGKTFTALAYYVTRVCGGELNKLHSMQTPRDVYVITTAKVRDGHDFDLAAARMHVHANPKHSTNGVKITVDSWNNINKYKDIENAFFIFDEQRVVGYGAWSKAFIKIARANQWILLSATPGDTWMDYIPVFIANGWYKHKTDFIDQHVIWTPRVKYPKVLRYQGVNKLVKHRNEVLVHMPFERHTKRHVIDIMCDYDQDAFDKVVKKRWHVFEKRPLRDVAELFIVMRKVVNTDSSRLEAVENLLSKHPKLIVFYNFDYELEMLRTLVPNDQLASPESIKELAEKVNGSRTESLTKSSVKSSPPRSTKTDFSSDSPSTSEASHSSKKQSGGKQKKPTSSTELSGESDWDYLLSPEGYAANCPGHWTVDRGEGEAFVKCGGRICRPTIGSGSKNSSTDSKTSSKSPSTPGSETPSGTFSVAEWNGHKHEPIPKTDRWVYLVQYRAGAEGWNCIETDAMCFYSQTYSYRDFFQAHGRIDRLNTPFTDLWYYNLISSSLIDKAIRKALKVKKNFNERDLKLSA